MQIWIALYLKVRKNQMKMIIAASGLALIFTAGTGHYSPAAAQGDATAIRKSCVKQMRQSQGLQKGQPLGRGQGASINACIANGGKL